MLQWIAPPPPDLSHCPVAPARCAPRRTLGLSVRNHRPSGCACGPPSCPRTQPATTSRGSRGRMAGRWGVWQGDAAGGQIPALVHTSDPRIARAVEAAGAPKRGGQAGAGAGGRRHGTACPHRGAGVASLTVAVPCRGSATDWLAVGPSAYGARGMVGGNGTILAGAAGGARSLEIWLPVGRAQCAGPGRAEPCRPRIHTTRLPAPPPLRSPRQGAKGKGFNA